MAHKYSFWLSTPLRVTLTNEERGALEYTLNGGVAPESLPADPYFADGLPKFRITPNPQAPPDAHGSSFWIWRNETGDILWCGVRVALDGVRLEEAYGTILHFAQWVATLADSPGYVGAVTSQEDGSGRPLVLFIYDSELFVAQLPLLDLQGMTTGRRLTLPPT